MPLDLVPKPQRKRINAFFLFAGNVSSQLDLSLSRFDNSVDWKLEKISVDKDVALAFRVVRLPTLVLYNEVHEETGRAIGEQNITAMVENIFSGDDS